MIIRAEVAADHKAIQAIVTAAFGQPDEARLVEALRLATEYDPELSLVAVEDEEVLGHVLLTAITIDTERGPSPALALAPVAVSPERQRHGVGSALIREALKRAKNKGHEAVIVLGHPEYYPRFGFVPASQFGIRVSFAVPDEAFMALELKPGALEGRAGAVRYPPAFGV
jgi:putative acetyltransferase